MPSDRKADRHKEGSRHQITVEAPLWARFGQVVGDGNRSLYIRDLIERFLDQRPMPALPGIEPEEAAKAAFVSPAANEPAPSATKPGVTEVFKGRAYPKR